MKVAIIGAGVAGLASARRAQQYDLECTVFEVTGKVGGTWVYTENPFADEFNNPVLSSVYSSTRIVSPTPIFQLEGLEFKPKSGLAYPGHEEVLEYIQTFSKKYNLQRYIKFYNKVLRISRETNVWKLMVQDLKENTYANYLFDAVVVCNGRTSIPKLPEIRGMETFPGNQIHSHFYRRKDSYKDKRLLIVGAGNSAQDISIECSKIAKKVYLSYRTPPKTNLEGDIELKGLISSIDGCRIQFEDNTCIDVDSIIHCTGYKYDSSLLDPSCGIEILEGQIFKPLFKMFINANQPTMVIMGLVRRSFNVKLSDLQAQVFMKYLEGLIRLPSTEDMLKSFNDEYNKRRDRGVKYYFLEREAKEYYNDLAQMANLEPMPLVLWNLFLHSLHTRRNRFATFRNDAIKIIDNENFEFEQIDDTQIEIKTTKENAESESK